MKRDLAAARTYLVDDLVFVGLFQTYRSAEEYLKALTGLLQVTVRLEVKKIIGQGNDAAVFFDLETKALAEAKVLVAEMASIQKWKDCPCPIGIRWPALCRHVRHRQVVGWQRISVLQHPGG